MLKNRRTNDFRIEAGLAMAYAAIAEKGRDEEAARKALRAGGRAAQIMSEHRTAKRGQGLGLLATGRVERRRRERREHFLNAAKAFEAAARKASDETWLDHLHRGRALIEAGKAEEALEALAASRAALPDGRPERALVAAVLAGAQVLSGDVPAAEATFKEAGAVAGWLVPAETRALEPAPPPAAPLPAPSSFAGRLGQAYLDAGRADDALDQAEAALQANPKDVFALALRVRAHKAVTPARPGDAKVASDALAAACPDAAWAKEEIEALTKQLEGGTESVAAGLPEAAELPPDVQALAKRLNAEDPFDRVAAADQLLQRPVGPSIIARHLEREKEPFVVGEIANLLARQGVREAVPALQKAYRLLGPMDFVARGRVLRAMGSLGDPAALPEILRAASEGEGSAGGGGHAVVAGLLVRLDDTARIRFQRSLVESANELDRALAPVFANHMIAERMTLVDAERDKRSAGLNWLRSGLGLALVLVVFVRIRLWQREKRFRKLAEHGRRMPLANSLWDTKPGATPKP